VRPNNTRQALLLLLFFFLLLHYFSPPSTSSFPQPHFSAGFILQLTLSLSSSPFSVSYPPLLLVCTSSPGSPSPLLPGVLPLFCRPVPFKVPVLSFTVFIFALLCCVICCQVRSPVFVTHTYARVYLKTILCCFSCVCVFMNSFLSMLQSVQNISVCKFRRSSSERRFKRDAFKAF